MTAHVHDHDDQEAASPVGQKRARPRWLLPALIIAIVAGGLVLAGIVPLSTVLSAGLFGGMILMHVGGHGGHGGQGGHAAHGSGSADAGRDSEADAGRGSRGCH